MVNPEILVVRHGDTNYTGIYPDLTEFGVKSAEEAGVKMKEHIEGFDRVIVVASPAVRTQGTANIFLKAAGLGHLPVKTVRSLSNLEIKDNERFLEYSSSNSTGIYGEMWLTDELLQSENDITESRESVDKRAQRFLYHYTHLLDRLSKSNRKTLIIAFTHFEIGVNFLKGIYTEAKDFPIQEYPVHSHLEPISLELIDAEKSIYSLKARDIEVRCRYDFNESRFIYLNE